MAYSTYSPTCRSTIHSCNMIKIMPPTSSTCVCPLSIKQSRLAVSSPPVTSPRHRQPSLPVFRNQARYLDLQHANTHQRRKPPGSSTYRLLIDYICGSVALYQNTRQRLRATTETLTGNFYPCKHNWPYIHGSSAQRNLLLSKCYAPPVASQRRHKIPAP